MLYQITMTKEQHDALLRLIERANKQPEEKKNDDVRAIASIKVGSVVEVETKYRFTTTYTTKGDHFDGNEPNWESEDFGTMPECIASMKATLLESACEQMSSRDFDIATIEDDTTTMRFTLTKGEDCMVQEYAIKEVII